MTAISPVWQGEGVRRCTLGAPAKVNLGLRLVGVREDGYHLIESLFVPLDLADELELTVEEGAQGGAAATLECHAAEDAVGLDLATIPTDEGNLALRAAVAYLAAAGRPARMAIRLRKRVPSPAGLGGGSSDAAAVLRALAALWPAAVPPGALAKLALGLGADVPFFLDPRPALVSGIGECIEPIARLPRLCLLLANSGDSLATAQVYATADVLSAALTRPTPGSTMRAISALAAVGEGDERALGTSLRALLRNDLEPAALRLCPPVARIKRQLEDFGALAAGMSGSGATVFGVFADEARAREASKNLALQEPGWSRIAWAEGSVRD